MKLKLKKIQRNPSKEMIEIIKKANNKNDKNELNFRNFSKSINPINFTNVQKFERRLEFHFIEKNFNEIFHSKKNRTNSIDNKPSTSRRFFPKISFKNNNNMNKHHTINNFTKYIINKKKFNSHKKNNSFLNNMKRIKITGKQIFNLKKKIYKELQKRAMNEESQRISQIIDNDNEEIKNNINNINKKLIKYNCESILPSINNDYLKEGNKTVKNIDISTIGNKSTLKSGIYENDKEMNINNNSKSNDFFYDIFKEKSCCLKSAEKSNSVSKIEVKNKSNIDDSVSVQDNSDVFRDYEFEPEKLFSQLKNQYNFMEKNNDPNSIENKRNKALLKLKIMLNKKDNIKFCKILQSKRRIDDMKKHNFFK